MTELQGLYVYITILFFILTVDVKVELWSIHKTIEDIEKKMEQLKEKNDD